MSGSVSAGGGASSRSGRSVVGRRRRMASMARWWTIDSSHVFTLPRPSTYRVALRHTPRKASWTTSSARMASVGDPECDRVGHRLVSLVQLLECVELAVGDACRTARSASSVADADASAAAGLTARSSWYAHAGRSGSPSGAARRRSARSPAATASRRGAARIDDREAPRLGAAIARNPLRTRRWNARSYPASKRVCRRAPCAPARPRPGRRAGSSGRAAARRSRSSASAAQLVERHAAP